MTAGPSRPMSPAEQVALREAIRELLEDPDAGLSIAARHRWEGALATLEAVLGEHTTLPVEHPEDFIL